MAEEVREGERSNEDFDIGKWLTDQERYAILRQAHYDDRKQALEDAADFVDRRIRPMVQEDIAILRADEALEPKPGYMVSGVLVVSQVLPVAAFLVGDDVRSSDGRYGSYGTRPKWAPKEEKEGSGGS